MIIIGIDPRKSSLTAVAVDASGRQLAARRYPVNAGIFGQLIRWTQLWPRRQFAVEGANGPGRGIAQQLAAASEDVFDVPATLAVRARLLDTGGTRKIDAADGAAVAHVALPHPGLRRVVAEDQSTILRLLSERRDDLAHERTRVLDRLHGLLRDLVAGGAPTRLSADQAAAIPRTTRPKTVTTSCRRDLAYELLSDLRRIDTVLQANEGSPTRRCRHDRKNLGRGPRHRHRSRRENPRPRRRCVPFPHADHFASYTGTSPLDASSGNRNRHRLNTGGNRQLNCALHTIAVCQARDPGPGRVYYLQISEGKTPAEARRALKRRLTNVIYRQLDKDQHDHLTKNT
ncbi:IS110 family transposase [Actinoplanes sp. CA-030573]|uniref:IS110 family transposase n=1 Tax=Actinoplanes sp. CA-030573 TaxID=3239898 RepID=UPI003D8B4FB2